MVRTFGAFRVVRANSECLHVDRCFAAPRPVSPAFAPFRDCHSGVSTACIHSQSAG